MENNWTNEQEDVIRHSEGDLLVAAAAGSGKTAVLVERIVTMLQEPEHPIDIDRMLVVTFTRAAAAEMKERIGNRIADLILEQPENEQLQRQQLLLHHARITTIDSFCMQVVKEFFHMTNLDPGFRIGDEAEMRLLRSDVLKELLEEKYAAAEEGFLRLVECYAPGKTDAALEEYVMKLFLFSESYEWPDQWLVQQAEEFSFAKQETFFASELIQLIMAEISSRTALALEDIRKAEELVNEASLEGYRATIQADRKFLEILAAKSEYPEFSECIRAYHFSPIGRCAKDTDPQARESAKMLRDRCKDTVNELVKLYFFQTEIAMYEDMVTCAAHMQELVRLTLEFRQKYTSAKQDKNLLDFSDLGHYALQILLENKEGVYVPSEAAGILRGRFDRIMVDEYQDSNQIQERLLWAVSGVHDVSTEAPGGRPNVFTVGDVKQSIYGFRQARPQLFMDKYDAYGQGDPAYQKIILKQNFRSRPHVLDAVNSVFEWCMHRNFGRIEYDADAALHAGLSYEVSDGKQSPYDPELILVHHSETMPEEEAVEKVEAEAKACAERIRSLTGENGLLITEKGVVRRARPGDIAILLRSAKGWAETFVRVLKDMDIPANAAVSTGFFEAGEVVTVLNYLRILDNPKQDIPLVQVLLSPVYGFTNNELARIRCGFGKLYDVLVQFAEDKKSEGELKEKVRIFLEQYRDFRQRMKYLSVSELLLELYRKTELYRMMSALPAGEQRVANLEYLLLQAQNFATTSYHGVFQFVRYVEKLKENEMDFGEASTALTQDAVKIMTIHKSKGLEYPIVLVPGCGKKFNQTDANTRIVLHADYGLGPECIDSEHRTRMTTLKKQYIRQMLKQETIAEELRMLYVAMTRAKEKLILVGSVADGQKFLETCAGGGTQIDYRSISSANSYLDFIKGTVLHELSEREFTTLAEENLCVLRTATTGNPVVWHFVPVRAGEFTAEEALELLEEEQKKQRLMEAIRTLALQEEEADYLALRTCASFCYPFAQATKAPWKTSVSELKRRSMQAVEQQDAAQPAWVGKRYKQEEKTARRSGISAAERGTLYHKMLELLPFAEVRTTDELLRYRDRLVRENRLTASEAECIETECLMRFLESDLAERIRCADADGRLKREQPFVLGLETKEGSGDYELIQGMIDLYFEEEDGFVLVDYKTDYVAEEDDLAERYRIQLMYYAQAIRQIAQKPVKDIYIYSLHLSRVIRLE